MDTEKLSYMTADKAVSGSQGVVWVTYNDTGERYCFARLVNLEAKAKLNKATLPVLGRTGKVHKLGSWEGSGTAKMYYCDSTMRKRVAQYQNTGKMFTMDIEVYNDDETSSIDAQAVTLKECLLDEIVIAKIDAEADYLEEEISFTFDDFDIPDEFNER